MDYRDTNNVIDFLSNIDFSAEESQPENFTSTYAKYSCRLNCNGNVFFTSIERNPSFQDAPTVTDVLSAMLDDAQLAQENSMDDFIDRLGFAKPSEAFHAYENCNKTRTFLFDRAATTSRSSPPSI